MLTFKSNYAPQAPELGVTFCSMKDESTGEVFGEYKQVIGGTPATLRVLGLFREVSGEMCFIPVIRGAAKVDMDLPIIETLVVSTITNIVDTCYWVETGDNTLEVIHNSGTIALPGHHINSEVALIRAQALFADFVVGDEDTFGPTFSHEYALQELASMGANQPYYAGRLLTQAKEESFQLGDELKAALIETVDYLYQGGDKEKLIELGEEYTAFHHGTKHLYTDTFIPTMVLSKENGRGLEPMPFEPIPAEAFGKKPGVHRPNPFFRPGAVTSLTQKDDDDIDAL